MGGAECTDVTLSSDYTQITCSTPEEPSSIVTSGNRGATLYLWNNTDVPDPELDLSSIADQDWATADVTEHLQGLEYSCEYCGDHSVAVLTGWFIAPSDNEYKFILRGDDSARLNISLNGDPADMVTLPQTPTFTPPPGSPTP